MALKFILSIIKNENEEEEEEEKKFFKFSHEEENKLLKNSIHFEYNKIINEEENIKEILIHPDSRLSIIPTGTELCIYNIELID